MALTNFSVHHLFFGAAGDTDLLRGTVNYYCFTLCGPVAAGRAIPTTHRANEGNCGCKQLRRL